MTEWASNFSFDYLSKLYSKIQKKFIIAQLKDLESHIKTESKTAFIRHDIDICPQIAAEFADWEASLGFKSTYHFMLESPFYKLSDHVGLVQEIHNLGHEIGLHYDLKSRGVLVESEQVRAKDIENAADEMAVLIGSEVQSVSFHRPISELLNGPLRAGGRVSAYASPVFKWYLSDSRGRWREGDPLISLDLPRSNILQILIHPIWWGLKHETPQNRLSSFIKNHSIKSNRNFHELNNLLFSHIDLRAEATV